ncbi:MAG: type II toxin-antitoxin system HicA family toxin [Desulfobulbaceae bacterium]|nr:type II toxin-antitoxin system HicA family toxin [Desulfobulbaceae bacterium]
MKSITGKDLCRLLERKGWEMKRIKGSHHIWAKSGNPVRISVPVHGNKPLKIGLLKHFMKVAGIKENEL